MCFKEFLSWNNVVLFQISSVSINNWLEIFILNIILLNMTWEIFVLVFLKEVTLQFFLPKYASKRGKRVNEIISQSLHLLPTCVNIFSTISTCLNIFFNNSHLPEFQTESEISLDTCP